VRDEIVPVRAVTADQVDHTYGIILLTVKNPGPRLRHGRPCPSRRPRTVIVPFENGMSHLDRLNERFGRQTVLGGVVKVATTLDERGNIVRLTPWASLTIGTQPTPQPVDLAEVAKVLDVEGHDFAVSTDIVTDMWAKWSFIATIGALTCLLRGTIGEIVAVPAGADVAQAVLDETVLTAAACGFPVPVADIEATQATITANGSGLASSMYRDLTASHATELEPILGDLVDRAQARGIDTPILRLAVMQLRVYENRLLNAEQPSSEVRISTVRRIRRLGLR
jgi:2-dehydropantoate 2-reductase